MKAWLPDIIRGLFILLFAYTGFSKIFAIKQFQFILSSSPLIGNYSRLVAMVLPVIELLIAALMFIPRTTVKGIVAGTCLLFLFTVYLIFMVSTTSNLPCACGGVLQQLSWTQHIAFNIFFIVTGIIFIYLHHPQISPPKKQVLK